MATIVPIIVNGRPFEAQEETSLLKALLKEGFDVPHLCYHETVSAYGSCRLCLVEVERGGWKRMATSCNYPVRAGLKVLLDTEEVVRERKNVFEVLLAQAPGSARLRDYASRYGVQGTGLKVQEGSCILCGLCERVCNEVIGSHAIGFSGRGARKELSTPYAEQNPGCIGCGSCARVCPTDCIVIVDRGLERELPFIHARHDLVPCTGCGAATVTGAHARWLAARTGIPEQDHYLCDRCKAKRTAASSDRIT